MGTLQKISFEFFPPRYKEGSTIEECNKVKENLEQTIRELNTLTPKFMTMTYGAAGSERANFLNNVKLLQTHSGTTPIVAHLTFYNTPKDEILALADTLWNNGIRHILALRGDKPKKAKDKTGENYFRYTSEFVEALKNRQDFEISVATYPQKHPDSGRIQDDITALQKKQDAGATSAITQVVFNPNAYFRFRDECVKQGITIPIIPGILPITDYDQTKRFLSRCGGTMPLSITLEFNKCASQDDHIKKGEALLIRHLERYIKEGVPHLHFYTLNRTQPLMRILPQFL